MREILEQNGLTGWKIFSVVVLDKKENEVTGYHGLSITGRCGPIDYTKCEIFEKRPVPTGPISKFFKGRYIGLEMWDGSDFFLPKDSLGIIVTKVVAEIIKNTNLPTLN